MLLHSISESAIALIDLVLFDPLFKTPVVSVPCDSCVTLKGGPQMVVRVKFILVGLVNHHKSQNVVSTGA